MAITLIHEVSTQHFPLASTFAVYTRPVGTRTWNFSHVADGRTMFLAVRHAHQMKLNGTPQRNTFPGQRIDVGIEELPELFDNATIMEGN